MSYLPPLDETVSAGEDEWCFQQDSVLAHEAKKKKCKKFARAHPRFYRTQTVKIQICARTYRTFLHFPVFSIQFVT